MIWIKSHKLNVVALGATNGLLFGASVEIILRSLYFYEWYLHKKYLPHLHIPLPYGYPLDDWWFLTILSFVCATAATFIVHRCFAQYIKSSVWFWQIVGVGALFVCAGYSMLYISYQVYLMFDVIEVNSVVSAIEGDLCALLLASPIVATFNLLFALVLKWRNLNLP